MSFDIRVGGPIIDDDDIQSVIETLRQGRLSGGIFAEKFEKEFAKFTGVKYAVAVNSATAALQLMLATNDIGKGDEVITTPYTFAATANVILQQNAKPVFVDIESDFYNIDAAKIEEKITENTKAIMPIHYGGQISQMDKIRKIAKKFNLLTFEDAAPAAGAELNGKKAGSLSDAGAFSFFPDKNMTTGEGGMLTTNSEYIAERARIMKKHGAPTRYHHTEIGWNFKMPDMNAALGISQLKKLPKIIRKKNELAKYYNDILTDELRGQVEIPKIMKSSYHTFNIYNVKFENQNKRDKVKKHLEENKIETRICFPPVHLQPIYMKIMNLKEGSFPISEKSSKETLCLPMFANITNQIQDDIVNHIKNILGK
jgi:perosamine synthetase